MSSYNILHQEKIAIQKGPLHCYVGEHIRRLQTKAYDFTISFVPLYPLVPFALEPLSEFQGFCLHSAC